MADRLSRATLERVPSDSRPLVTPGDAGTGIVHIGVGAFHRAHQAVYTEAAMAAEGGDWAITGVAPRRRELVDTLAAQDGLFSVTSLDDDHAHTRVVAALGDVRHAPSDPAGIVSLIADPDTRIVTLTVTEKAYGLDPATGGLQVTDSLRAELSGRTPPSAVPALLALGLVERARAASGPIAVVSCDNLPSNGRLLRSAVGQALELIDEGPIDDFATFPGTMVDRIVPAATAGTLDAAASALGVRDDAAVTAEPYSEWIIEDRFPGGRPAWQAAGAVLTDDAGPYERLKLRALNGVHSALAYLGGLAGCETISKAVVVPGMADMLRRFVADDVAPGLRPPPGVSVVAYGDSVLERFANPAIGHRTAQVAMDGSQKLPQRLLHTIADRRTAGAMPQLGALIVAAWMRYIGGRDDHGRPLELNDPLADVLRAALDGAADPVRALLGVDQIFTSELAQDGDLTQAITSWYTALERHGVADVLASLTTSSPGAQAMST